MYKVYKHKKSPITLEFSYSWVDRGLVLSEKRRVLKQLKESEVNFDDWELIEHNCDDYSTKNEQNAYRKEVELIQVDDRLYLISRKDAIGANELCLFCVNGMLVVAYPDELLGDGIDWVARIITEPELIGYFRESSNWQTRWISEYNIERILKNDGICYIDVIEIEKIVEPKLFNGRVVISI